MMIIIELMCFFRAATNDHCQWTEVVSSVFWNHRRFERPVLDNGH